MADFNIQPVGTQIKPVQPMSLADMINMARGVQAYQQAQQINPLEVQRAQTELSRLQQLTPEEVAKAIAERKVSEATVTPRITRSEAEAGTALETEKTAKVGTQSATMKFANEQVNAIANRLTGLINNPLIIASEEQPNTVDSVKLQGVIKKYAEEQASSLGIPKEKADQLIGPYLDAAKNPASFRDFLKDKLLATLDQGARLTAMQPSGQQISTGAAGYTVQTGQFGPQKPGKVLPGTAYEMELGPNQRAELSGNVDEFNRPTYFVRDKNGKFLYEAIIPAGGAAQPVSGPTRPSGAPNQPAAPTTMPSPSAAAPSTPSAEVPNVPVRPPPGESRETGKLYQQQIIDARGQAQPANIALNNVRTIRQYLPLAQTGRASEAISGLQSVLGNVAGSKPEELAAAARDIIEKNISDLAIQKNAALGGKFAADLSAVQSSLASAGKNPTAIAKVMDQLEPLLQHVYNYQRGLDLAVQRSPQKQFIKPEFDRRMNDAFDLQAMMMYNAWKNGGDDGLKKFNKENGINLVKQRQLFDKLRLYDKLTEGNL